jgi:hypothetical protein
MILPHLQIARAHWVLGALFLAILIEEYVPLLGGDGRPVRNRSLVVPWGLMLGAAGVWATTVFADNVHDMLVHTLWADILFAAGALELARRRGVYERPWLDSVLPLAFVCWGSLFVIHVLMEPSAVGGGWHLAMGALLISGGLLELVRLQRPRAPRIPLAALPLAGFALALIAIPISQAT